MLEFNLKQLEAFVAAAEQGSFTRAAQSLYLTQSTVSAHIQTLEKALGQTLFRRDARRAVSLTEAGRAVYPRAREILSRCQSLQGLFREEGQPDLLELAASTVPCQCLLPGLMAGFLAARPGCRYQLRKGDSAQVHRWLAAGEARLGFVGARLEPQRFRYQPLLQDRLVLVTANTPRFRALWDDGVLGTALLEEPMIVREEGSGTRQRFDAYLREIGRDPDTLQIVAEIDQPDIILSAVASGVGVAVSSRLAARESLDAGRLLAFDLDTRGYYRELCLTCLQDTALTPLEQAFWNYAAAHSGG